MTRPPSRSSRQSCLARGSVALALVLGCSVAIAPSPGHAQQAADVATARRLAGEGIKLYEAGDYAGALERLERAQALYAAPTHLLFIARSQAKAGRLVESAETYRKLGRIVLDAGAPQAFRDAVTASPKELAALEPTIPLLTISVQPSDAPGLTLEIDGAPVSSAAIGVERPVNPGKHVIAVSAPGYAAKSLEIEVPVSARAQAELKLERSADRPPATPKAGPSKPASAEAALAKPDETAEPPPFIGFLVGLRLGGALTGGSLDSTRSMPDYYGPGVGGVLHAGVRFPSLLKPVDLGISLFVGGYALRPGSELNELGSLTGQVTNVVNDEEAGFVLTVSGKRHTVAPFGEVGLTVLQRVRETRDFDLADGGACQTTQKWEGGALTFAGGVHFPLATWFSLSPYVGGSIGQFHTQSFAAGSGCPPGIDDFERNIATESRGTHMLLGLGVGGEVWIGKD